MIFKSSLPIASLRWLLIELIVATVLCMLPIVWTNVFDAPTFTVGLILASIFLVLSEWFRQFKPATIIHWFEAVSIRNSNTSPTKQRQLILTGKSATLLKGGGLEQSVFKTKGS